MTSVKDIENNKDYIKILDKGFVGYVDHMGSDVAITQAARTSYGKGTRQVSEERSLLRYLVRNRHTSPLEMVEIKFHIKIPMFIANQLVRHRTANLNFYSGRYSIMTEEFYMPDIEVLAPQSQTNKQGRDGNINDEHKHIILKSLDKFYKKSYNLYSGLLGKNNREIDTVEEDDFVDELYNSDEYNGLSRELSRSVLPMANYTECYWKCDLHNLFHFLRLRLDEHAQYEIRILANAMYAITKKYFPVACEAFEDYIKESRTASRMEREFINDVMNSKISEDKTVFDAVIESIGGEDKLVEIYGFSKREITEFKSNFVKKEQ